MRILAVVKNDQAKVLAGQFDLGEENFPAKIPLQLQIEVTPEEGKLFPVDQELFGKIDLTPHTDHLFIQV